MDMVLSTPKSIDKLEPSNDVLPPDHPLMQRFQNALQEHLLKVKSQLDEEIANLDHSIAEKDLQIAEVGSKLFDLQNETEKQRQQLDKYSLKISEMAEKRKVSEEIAAKLRKEFDAKEIFFKDAKHIHNETLHEIDSLHILENEISKWNEEIQSEVALAKRVTSKDSKDQRSISEEKKKLDLILFKLDEEVRKRERELENIDDQIKEHEVAVDGLNKSLCEANIDLEGLQHEHSKLMQAWGEVIVAIQQRDKMLEKAKTDLFNEKQEHKVIKSNIENTKKFILKETEINEKLTNFKNRLLANMTAIEKQVQISESEEIKLEQKIDHFNKVLETTDMDLQQARSEGLLTKNHISKLVTKLEKQAREKFEIEEKILDLLQDQITTDKAGEHRGKILRDAQEKRRKLEIAMSNTENQMSIMLLQLEKARGNVQRAKENVELLKKDHDEANTDANNINTEIDKLKLAIVEKLRALDILSKELDQLISASGGKEVNPYELEATGYVKSITDLDSKIKESQQSWMRLQAILVQLTEKRAQQVNDIFVGRKQLMVIEQKAMKVETELQNVSIENRDVIRSLTILNQKLDQTNAKLFEKRKHHEKEEVECELAHQEMVNKLKDAEMGILNLEQELNDLAAEIEETKKLVVEKHHEALSWETKFKMAVDTKKLKDEEEANSSEIGIMKAEIHRMEVKFSQLKKQQEKMVQQMENCVHHRDHIYDAAYTREKMTGSKTKTQTNIKHKINEMQNKLKIINSDLSLTQRHLNEVGSHKSALKDDITARDEEIQKEKVQDKLLQTEIEQSMLLKQQNLENIIKRQQRAKRYRYLQTCQYLPKMKSEVVLDAETQRQHEIHENLLAILDSLERDFPSHKFSLAKIYQTLKD